MKRYKLYALTLLLTGLSSTGCREEFLVEKPLNIIAPDNLYVNREGFESGLFGLYNLVRRERAGIGTTGSGAPDPANDLTMTAAVIGVDNAFSLFPAGGAPEQVFNEFGILLNSINPYVRSLWEWLYQIINASNTIINRAENPNIKWTAAEKNQIVGEARLIRAWAYRHLTFLYGDVPLNLKESTGSTIRTDWERTPVAEVRKQMETDLLFAETNMAETPATEGRMPRAVATHYLAELYLTIGDNSKAKQKAQSLIANPLYKLITARYGVRRTQPGTPFTDMFIDGNSNRTEGNTEAIWVIQNQYQSPGGDNNIMRRWWVNRYDRISVGGRTPITFSIENGGRGIGRFGITRFGLNLYEPTDDRGSYHAIRRFWLMNNPASLPTNAKLGDTVRTAQTGLETLNNQNWPNTRKWDWAPSVPEDVQQSSSYNDQIYLRLGETYLLLAEAHFKLGETAEAVATINTLRARAKARPITAAELTLDFILDERSRELLTEEHRRYTLLRTGKWLERTRRNNAIAGSKITERDQLLPIPQSVIDANLTKTMPQNPGY
ncbi:RagB/SusD family nutrient uptake outer membrane protein [Rudanella paleaurantiibacter]|uniref:RagB/SusD family nutrient uptake outer membrane protein n=1 Tax=Rudanella paleaurantiibacter TaxID=2614655 RepID=A0A7J5TW49_9BACT|nr:RagB/SusD family nutrient uptake outer membrane protein [Rudanella paleaurantiibacter]KAB7727362.1 RagB/SusD family nutrient uptake outer membrane protein [Rudanella paleaurantiibacter]